MFSSRLVLGFVAIASVASSSRSAVRSNVSPSIVPLQPVVSAPLSANSTEDRTVVTGQVSTEADTAEACPAGMVEVEGDYCPVVEQVCVEYISEARDRCARYREQVRCYGKPKTKHFCVDRYEYPNERGAKPSVAVTWDEARDLCAADGKRLCTAEEWTLACEGPERTPYPYGFARDDTACNQDQPYRVPDDQAYRNPATRSKEVKRLDQSEPSGSREQCQSSLGVYDLTGNVDEWVMNEEGSRNGPEYWSGLKGGYWGPVRNRCRPITTDHNAWHSGYQIGFRCCKDPGLEAPKDASASASGTETNADASALMSSVEPVRS